MNRPPRVLALGLVGCHLCGLVVKAPGGEGRCPRCGSRLHARKPQSVAWTWALLIASMIFYLPANLLPIMRTTWLGAEEGSTILQGVAHFIWAGDWLLAGVIFVASVLVPVLKMLSLLYLLLTLRWRGRLASRHRARLHRITELVGRWSMVDVFVIGLLTALVQMGVLTRIEPGPGALAFAAVVILTMLAAETFDPRLLWDQECR